MSEMAILRPPTSQFPSCRQSAPTQSFTSDNVSSRPLEVDVGSLTY